jgi:hypothetical protein
MAKSYSISNARSHLAELVSRAEASVVLHELRIGLERLDHSKKKSMIKDYLENVINRSITFLPYDNEAASWHAKERARLERYSAHYNCAL